MDLSADTDTARHWALIRTPPGVAWSGRSRYAAAMYFYQAGMMDAETLEIYRICSRLDEEEPLAVMQRWHVGQDWISLMKSKG